MVVAVQYIEKEQGGDQTHDVTGILAVQGGVRRTCGDP